MKNNIKVTFSHKSFLINNMKSFCTEIQDKKIEFSFDSSILELNVCSENDYEELRTFCLELDCMMFLYLGSFPTIESIFYNGELQDITNLANRFTTDSRFIRSAMMVCKITSETINEEIYLKFKEDILLTAFYSMQYLVSNAYKAILPVHRITLLSHVVEGVIDIELERRKEIDSNLREKFKITTGDSLGKYFIGESVVLSVFIEEDRLYNSEILEILGTSEYNFLDTIKNTRAWYSHMWKQKEKINKLNDGKQMVTYFEIIYYAIRLYLIKEVLQLKLETELVREHLYILHDWIVEKESLQYAFKSNTYLISESRKKMEQEIAELMKQMEDESE